MADPATWGLLPKAQDDATTVDEAIVAAIAAHNADPTAHLISGGSLDLHRTNDVIDHPATSVPLDKVSSTQLYHYDNFLSPTSTYSPTGTVNSGQGFLQLSPFHAALGEADATVPIPFFQNAHFPANEIVAQFDFSFDWNTSADTGLLYFGASGDGFGLKVASNAVKAFLVQNGTFVYSAALTYTKGATHTARIDVVPAEGNVYFYLDGALVATIALGSSSAPDLSVGFYLEADCTLTTYSTVTVSGLRVGYARDLL